MNIYTEGQIRYADIFYVFGQSNAVGIAYDENVLPLAWRGEQPHINVYWEGSWSNEVQEIGHFEKMWPLRNSAAKSGGGYGIEQSLAQALSAETLNEVYVVKTAVGGQAISSWFGLGFAWNELPPFVETSIEWLLERGITPRVKCFVWMQGESQDDPDTYFTDFTNVMANVRALNPTYLDDAPWISIKLRADVSGTTSYAIAKVNEAFEDAAAADSRVHYIDPTPVTDGPGEWGGLHYGDQGYINIGQAIFDYMKANDLIHL